MTPSKATCSRTPLSVLFPACVAGCAPASFYKPAFRSRLPDLHNNAYTVFFSAMHSSGDAPRENYPLQHYLHRASYPRSMGFEHAFLPINSIKVPGRANSF
jgi:hypothetical protein